MKKLFSLFLCAVVLFSFAACSGDDKESDDKNTSSTEEASPSETASEVCDHVIEERVYKEAAPGVDGMNIKVCTVCSEILEYVKVPALPDAFKLTVTDKYTGKDSDKDVVCFDIEIENISDKTIESVTGSLSVLPSFGMLVLDCEFTDIYLQPGDTLQLSSFGFTLEDAEDDSVEKRVYDASFDELKFSFEPIEVIIED